MKRFLPLLILIIGFAATAGLWHWGERKDVRHIQNLTAAQLRLLTNEINARMSTPIQLNLVDDVLEHSLLPGYGAHVRRADKLLFQSAATSNVAHRWRQQTALPMHGVNWSLTVWPSAQLLSAEHSLLPEAILSMGSLMSLLLGFAVFLAQLARKREREQQRLQQELLQAKKMQAIGTLAGGIAHDFNNMLYAITGFLYLSQEDVSQESITYQNLAKALEVSEHAKELVSQILIFSREQESEFGPIYLQKMIDDNLAILQPTCLQTTKVCKNYCEQAQPIVGNTSQLQQVLVNLITNAADAMDENGVLTITTVRHAETMELRFADNGSGMSPATTARIFEPFFTTKEVDQGTGLGLSIVHGIIQEHQGEIRVDSTLGQGTTFTLLLPRVTKG